MAFNFWFHPADLLPGDGGTSAQPYGEAHWSRRWALYHAAEGPRKPLELAEDQGDGEDDGSDVECDTDGDEAEPGAEEDGFGLEESDV